jgi:hypothetical protein
MTAQASITDRTVTVAPLPQLSSPTLAKALAERDFPAILEALSFDVVLLPVAPDDHGNLSTRVFAPNGTTDGPHDLLVFSSATTFGRFLGHSDQRLFRFIHGAAVVAYLQAHLEQIGHLVIDPAGPHGVSIPALVLAALLDQTEVAEPTDQTEATEVSPAAPVAGFDVALPAKWGQIHLDQLETRDQQIRRLVQRQTTTLGDRGATLRRDMRAWLNESAAQAQSAGGQTMAFFLSRHASAALALSTTTYLHDLATNSAPGLIMDDIATALATKAGPHDELARVRLNNHTLIRHVRVQAGHKRMGGKDVPLLMADYWLPAPDGRHVAHVSFTSPHLTLRDVIIQLADNMVLGGTWRFDPPNPPPTAGEDSPLQPIAEVT